eukprot:CAMPEP_0118913610 /NCGR_PEP_ID=MMETSP1166-20130328/14349_1 /TAXON_ID=1104430 /ORGANISM="Chrysoreinhardia sp, Strain CCMP3193" /LENGTH=40 /DNA_ID= /DNA_START= /DNA_END= /DNA_ORIENTATION=
MTRHQTQAAALQRISILQPESRAAWTQRRVGLALSLTHES